MDYIFEDDILEVGAEIDAYCTRCKTDTPHTVLSKYEEEIRSVLCTTCNTTHAYRAPKGDAEEEIFEPLSSHRRQTLQKMSWKEAMAQIDASAVQAYFQRNCYIAGDVFEHPKFGVGFVSDVLNDLKIEAVFKDGQRILVHNRADLSLPAGRKRSRKKSASSPAEEQSPTAQQPPPPPQPEPEPNAQGSKPAVQKATTNGARAALIHSPKAKAPKAKASKAKAPKAKAPKAKAPKAKAPKAKAPKAKASKAKVPKAKAPKAKAPKAKAPKAKAPKAKAPKAKAPKAKASKAKAPKAKAPKAKASKAKAPKAKAPKAKAPKAKARSRGVRASSFKNR